MSNTVSKIENTSANTETHNAEVNMSGTEGPGEYLKQLRVDAGMTEMEAASRLNISVQQLRSLENNDFENLPAPIFVRNYLTRYAELFEVNAQRLIESYDHFGQVSNPELARVSLRQSINSNHAPVRWATYSIVAAVIALAVYWASSMGVPDLFKNMSAQKDGENSTVVNEIALPTVPADTEEGTLEDLKDGVAQQ